jgi:hypothetical protein
VKVDSLEQKNKTSEKVENNGTAEINGTTESNGTVGLNYEEEIQERFEMSKFSLKFSDAESEQSKENSSIGFKARKVEING